MKNEYKDLKCKLALSKQEASINQQRKDKFRKEYVSTSPVSKTIGPSVLKGKLT
jgi:hypothetical protein